MSKFDKYANAYDAWFLGNENLLYSEVKLVAHFLKNCGHTLSIGCGTGLMERIMADDMNITITEGIEPSADMGAIARTRGMNVTQGTAEDTDMGTEKYDTILFNGCASYISNLDLAVERAHKALKPGGRVILVDVPKDSAYGTMYNLALALDTWDHPLLNDVKPSCVYPIELVRAANWRTTQEKIDVLTKYGFKNLETAQTLTTQPLYSNVEVEEPQPGFYKGSYVAVTAIKE